MGMKYLKKFKNTQELMYWRVPTGDKLKKALQKINCPEWFIDRRINYTYDYKTKFILICNPGINVEWSWDYDDYNSIENFNEDGYKFGGNIEIEDYEIDSEKYNL